MAIFTFTISASPVTLLNRSLDVNWINIGCTSISLIQEVFSLTSEGVRIIDNQCSPYNVVFTIDNTTLVDPTIGGANEGMYVISNGSGGWQYAVSGLPFVGTPVGLCSFLMALIGTGVVIGTYITKIVTQNDALGYYNI